MASEHDFKAESGLAMASHQPSSFQDKLENLLGTLDSRNLTSQIARFQYAASSGRASIHKAELGKVRP